MTIKRSDKLLTGIKKNCGEYEIILNFQFYLRGVML